MPAVTHHVDRDRHAGPQRHDALQVFKARYFLARNRIDPVTGLEAGAFGRTSRPNGLDDIRAVRLADDCEQGCKNQDREQEIGRRTGEHDEKSLPHRAELKRAVAIFGRNGAFIDRRARRRHVADEFHIAAKRHPADFPPSPLFVGPAHNLVAETDREGFRWNLEQARDEIVAEFVEEDERPERADERDDHKPERRIGQHVQEQLAIIMVWTHSRVTASICSTSLTDLGIS